VPDDGLDFFLLLIFLCCNGTMEGDGTQQTVMGGCLPWLGIADEVDVGGLPEST